MISDSYRNRSGSDPHGNLKSLIQCGEQLAENISQAMVICTQRPYWDKTQAGWRHMHNGNKLLLFLLMKLSGAASTANAMLILFQKGFFFQAAILARSIYDSCLNIVYMLPNLTTEPGGWPSQKQEHALDEFFKETWQNPETPLIDNIQRSHVTLKELSASIGKFQDNDSEISQFDAGQTALQQMRFLSDYTHMAYPRLMELYDGHSFDLSDKQQESDCFNLSQAARTIYYTCDTADNVLIFVIRMTNDMKDIAILEKKQSAETRFEKDTSDLQGIQEKVEALLKHIQKNFQVYVENPKLLMRKFKGK